MRGKEVKNHLEAVVQARIIIALKSVALKSAALYSPPLGHSEIELAEEAFRVLYGKIPEVYLGIKKE